jgi:hypothetical protein
MTQRCDQQVQPTLTKWQTLACRRDGSKTFIAGQLKRHLQHLNTINREHLNWNPHVAKSSHAGCIAIQPLQSLPLATLARDLAAGRHVHARHPVGQAGT